MDKEGKLKFFSIMKTTLALSRPTSFPGSSLYLQRKSNLVPRVHRLHGQRFSRRVTKPTKPLTVEPVDSGNEIGERDAERTLGMRLFQGNLFQIQLPV